MSERSDSLPIVLDAMGGDAGAAPNVEGAVAAARAGVRILLVGDPVRLHAELGKHEASALSQAGLLEVVAATDVIGMDEHASDVRGRGEASINVAVKLVKDGRGAAVVSMGHSGATMASALLTFGRIPGVDRPAILNHVPTLKGFGVLLDVGANTDVKPQYLAQWARLASVYLRVVEGRENPSVGLLSIGEEEHKGNALVLEAHALLRGSADLNFYGNVEGKDIFKGTTDVVVTDGFTGNVVLKLAEGEAKVLFTWVREALTSSWRAKLGALLVRDALREIADRVDPSAYGASPLLGLRGLAFIGHGSADARAVKNALLRAARARDAALLTKLAGALQQV
ncbi:phosphate acyltransferase PlsX [Deinococcus peraridilitoris]|uniref:Phosphate acyltransferase n=1 Tax=Deinococcus peraridilitoris (strain DSM 19664 / LMG 22246 / CIP 109416 / KR-200) TaxID=937777 RepID=L0A673_DEIPD|nr:phosphate acyltransferase PlsX [Deinococcus peraridilitoris]AFZ68520.1 fatty acid/phospholipid synthesis protein PlsX [Deinococcus peraridilitoris DSM 19664]